MYQYSGHIRITCTSIQVTFVSHVPVFRSPSYHMYQYSGHLHITCTSIQVTFMSHVPVFRSPSYHMYQYSDHLHVTCTSIQITFMLSTLCDSAWISSVVSNRRPYSFNFIFGNRKVTGCQIRGVRWVGDDSHFVLG
jgi:hypothetical protein